MENYTTPVLLTAFYVAVQQDSDLFGRVVKHDKMCDWRNTRSRAAKVNLEIILIQMVDEIIWLQTKSLGSKTSKERGKGQYDVYVLEGRLWRKHHRKSALASCIF